MSRIRQIKPSWFLDKELRKGTSAEAREFYIGLWMLADDDGWLVWDEERIAAELYPFDPIARRERNVAKWAGQLEHLNEKAAHLVVYDCGHGTVPKMAAHQRIAGNRTTSTHRKHQETCRGARSRVALQVATEDLETPSATGSHGRELGGVGNGTVRNGTGSAREPAPSGAARSEFEDQIAAAGGVDFRKPRLVS